MSDLEEAQKWWPAAMLAVLAWPVGSPCKQPHTPQTPTAPHPTLNTSYWIILISIENPCCSDIENMINLCRVCIFFCWNQNFHPLLGQASTEAVHESNTSRLLYPGAATLSWTSCFFTYYRKVSFVSVHTTLKGMYWSAISREKWVSLGFRSPNGQSFLQISE